MDHARQALKTARSPWVWMAALAGLLLVTVPAVATAPPGRYTIANGTVRDNRTGLLWQQTADSGSYAQGEGMTYCSNLNLGGFATGWRLPTIAELLSIADRTASYPAIDTSAFPNAPPSYFWTASAQSGVSNYAWLVDFTNGSSNTNTPSTAYFVRCVR